jgi:2-hydroxy-6-oxonona-2,4-dienedioate hydrolase
LSIQFRDDPSRENVYARLRWLFHKPDRDISDELIDLRWELYQRSIGKPNPAAVIGGTAANLTPEVLAQIPVPMLFLWTDHNPSQQIAAAKSAMSYVRDAEFALIEDCGHWPQWESPDAFNRIVTEYLKK